MEKKIKVLFVIGRYYNDLLHEFGGTTREFYAIVNSFKDSEEVDMEICTDFDINKWSEYKKKYDIIHCEDNNVIKKLLQNKLYPDVIGPTAKSPSKNEKTWKEWKSIGIDPNDYYRATIVRNNSSEERINELWKKIKYIKLGVDTNKFQFSRHSPKRWVLWAGDVCREAKNFKMFMDIMKVTKLPNGYDWKVLSGYTLDHYIGALQHTALLVNTSKNETFCFAMFEANALGVPSIYPKGLHNPQGHTFKKQFHPNKRIQVNYTVKDFSQKIKGLLNNPRELEKERILARRYVEENASYKSLRDSLTDIYKEVYRLNKGYINT